MSSFIPVLFSNPADSDVDEACSSEIEIGTQNFPKIFEIADKIKSQKYTSKNVLSSIKKKLSHKNPNVQLLAIQLIDSLVKNCGLGFHKELVQKDVMDALVVIVRGDNYKVKSQTLELIEFCSKSFQNSELSYMSIIYRELRAEGYQFPEKPVNTTLIETTLVFPS